MELCPTRWFWKNCGRMQRKMTESDLTLSTCQDELKSTSIFYNDILHNRLKKVGGFSTCKFAGMSLLYNKNEIQEQKPHKDYKVQHQI